MKQIILTIITIYSISICYGQTNTYVGKVIMSNVISSTEEINVKIEGEGYELYTTINSLGEFYIDNPKYPFKVVFERIDIKKSSSKVKSAEDKLFITDLKYHMEVTVTGKPYRGVTGAAKTINIPRNAPPSKIRLELSKVAGVQVYGQGVVRVRGDIPKFIINGFGVQAESLNDLPIDMSDIKTIEALKGADAFIYGGPNCSAVLMITTW